MGFTPCGHLIKEIFVPGVPACVGVWVLHIVNLSIQVKILFLFELKHWRHYGTQRHKLILFLLKCKTFKATQVCIGLYIWVQTKGAPKFKQHINLSVTCIKREDTIDTTEGRQRFRSRAEEALERNPEGLRTWGKYAGVSPAQNKRHSHC